MTDLKGKAALVTDSTSGIGRAAALALDVVTEIEGGGGSATFRLTSLVDLESARDLVERATLAGDGHVDILSPT